MNHPQVIANYSVVVAHSFPEYGIGMSGNLPWHISADLKRFKELTVGKIVVMGRKTWESLPVRFKPLPNRVNIVVSRDFNKLEYNIIQEQYKDSEQPVYFTDWDSLIDVISIVIEEKKNISDVMFIGGGEIYCKALEDYNITSIYITEVYKNNKKSMDDFDTFFPSGKELKELQNGNYNKLEYCDVGDITLDEKSGLYYRFYTLADIDYWEIQVNYEKQRYVTEFLI